MDGKRGQPRALDERGVRALLEAVRARHGSAFELGAAFRGGEGPGAWSLRSADGPAVLKAGVDVSRLAAAGRALDALRERGYPAPRFHAWGTFDGVGYLIQERLPGAPMPPAEASAHVETIVRLNAMQHGLGDGLISGWPDLVADPVLHGGAGFCLHSTMREHNAETSQLLDRLVAIVSADADAVAARDDIVHLDFTFANVLVDRGRVSGVIDIQGCGCGDRAFDLVCFVFYVWDDEAVRERLWTGALELSGPAAVRVYAAHMILRQVEWSLRFHGGAETFMTRGRQILAALP